LVEIRSIAREAGYRSKVAVSALKPGVDPVGACVGIRGVRIQAIVRELSDEKIDVIEWNPNTEEFIAKALSPARVLSVFLNKEADGMPTATVVVPEDQLSLAIGRNGQNARLAAKLSGWRIDIKGLFEAVSDTLFKIDSDPRYTEYQELEAGALPRIETILDKKAEGRPITPEEYRELHNFNSRVEAGLIEERREITKQQQARIHAAREAVPDDAYDLPVMTLGLATRVENLLVESGLTNVGELAYRMLLIPSAILEIDGIGPSYVEQIETALEVMIGYEPLSEEFDIDDELILPGMTEKKEESFEEEPEESADDDEQGSPEAEEAEEGDQETKEVDEDQSPGGDETTDQVATDQTAEVDEEGSPEAKVVDEDDQETQEVDEDQSPEGDEITDQVDTDETAEADVDEAEENPDGSVEDDDDDQNVDIDGESSPANDGDETTENEIEPEE
jgi:N utilization substance protein A